MGILQEIIDKQYSLDERVIKEHNLVNGFGKKDLTVNFDNFRYQTILNLYLTIKKLTTSLKETNFKWWKNLDKLDESAIKDIIEQSSDIEYNPNTRLSNISMKVIAIIDELFEIEDAVNDNESKERIEDEFADLIHFVCSLGLELGINSEQQIENLYLKKNNVNHVRQNDIKKM